MSLSERDKAYVRLFWEKVTPRTSELGAQALARMLVIYPQTRVYFQRMNWTDFSLTSPDVQNHGANMMAAFGDAVKRIDDLVGGLASLRDLHANVLRLDPASHKFLSNSMLMVFAMSFPQDFTPDVQLSIDKFLLSVAMALS
ncbi:hemoglobin subunit alpha-A-like [Gouania willdenowi]|uniref:Hemoglobin subunit alpha-A-like n=1 Tax=Gouania willdenowi TaxID=441366 RepID=A0A8C5EE43_GOUWI|nr:hemoglobin subunit alpha-A-like [Gouania willdenowi]